MKHNAKRLRQVRESMGMTQEKLAILASVSERTVQRAEAGHTMSLETLNDFAAVLEMPLSELVIDPDEINAEEPLGLRRVQSPRSMIEDLAKAGVAVFECEVDASPAEIEPLLKLVEHIEARLPSPWEMDQHPGASSLREKLSVGAEVAALLTALTQFNIGLFTSASWIMVQYPRWDMDEGHRYTRDSQKFERVMALHLVIARASDDRLYRKAPTNWSNLAIQPTLTAAGEHGPDLDDDVPF